MRRRRQAAAASPDTAEAVFQRLRGVRPAALPTTTAPSACAIFQFTARHRKNCKNGRTSATNAAGSTAVGSVQQQARSTGGFPALHGRRAAADAANRSTAPNTAMWRLLRGETVHSLAAMPLDLPSFAIAALGVSALYYVEGKFR